MERMSNVCFIWYGDGTVNPIAVRLIGGIVARLGGTDYLLINMIYPDSNGSAPNGGFIFEEDQ